MKKGRVDYFVDLYNDVVGNNLGYRCNSGADEPRVRRTRGFLEIRDAAEYNMTAGNLIPNDGH